MPSLVQPWKVLLGEVQEPVCTDMLPSMNPTHQKRDVLTGEPPGLAVWHLNKKVRKADIDKQSSSVAKIPFRRDTSATDPAIAEPNAA